MKKILPVLFPFLVFHAFAQTDDAYFKISIGDEFKETLSPTQYAGMKDDRFYFTHTNMTLQLFGDLYNKDFEKILSTEIDDNYEDKRANFSNAVIFNNRLFLFFYKLRDKTAFYFMQEVDFETFAAIGKPQMLSEKELPSGALLFAAGQIGKFYSNPFAYMEALRPPFEVLLSADKSVMAVIIRWQGLEEDKSKYPIVAKVFNKDMELLWDKEFELPMPRKKFNDYYTGVDSLGNVYVGGAIENQQHKKVPHIFFISENGAMIKNCDIGSIGHYDGYYTYDTPSDGDITCTGIASSDEERMMIKGVWNYRISLRSMKIVKGDDLLFNHDIMSEYEKKKKIKNGGLAEFYPKFISTGTGAIYVVLESITMNNNKSRADVIICCFPQNQKPWARSFTLDERSNSIEQRSTLAVQFGDELNLFYNAEEIDINANDILNYKEDKEKPKYNGDVGIGVLSVSPNQAVKNKLLYTYAQLQGYEIFTMPVSDSGISLGFGNQIFIDEDNFKIAKVGKNFSSSMSRPKIKLVTITAN